ncbi:MAG: hypothetical protein WC742_11495 [Gallionellaceae bacterium]|jgi:hypothetical protein
MSAKKYYAFKKHFADYSQSQTLEDHYFEQLGLDLQWASDAADTFMKRDGVDPLTSLIQGVSALAGRRWSRFKAADEASDQKRASEMKAFALFWYRLAAEIEQKANGALK